MARIAHLIILTLILTGCASQTAPREASPSQTAPTATDSAAASKETQQSVSAPPPATPLARRVTTGGPERIPLAAGDTANKPGVYFLNVETGVGEAWVFPSGERDRPAILISDDNRFVWGASSEVGYLVDRETDALWQWDVTAVRPVLFSGQGSLFAELKRQNGSLQDTGRYLWTAPDFKPVHTFTIRGEQQAALGALLSPDGQQLALLLRGPTSALYLLDLRSGTHTALELPGATGWVGSIRLAAREGKTQVSLWVSEGDRTRDMPRWTELIRSYDWNGAVQGDMQIPGTYTFFSPDGRWVAYQEPDLLGGLAPVTVVAETTTLQPQFRVLGASTCFSALGSAGSRWLADSSGLALATTSDQYRLLSLSGSLKEPPSFAGRSWIGEPQPAPDKADRIAFGRTEVLDGTRQLGLKLDGFVTPRADDAWGSTSRELRFAVPPKAGGGACSELPPMDMRVLTSGEQVPEFPLTVRSNDCLPMRVSARANAGEEITCLAPGTRLKPVTAGKDQSPLVFSTDWALHVQTESGQSGWITLSGYPVTWTR